jgi:pimeloyl-ACP methyl ester carboxylesterase
VPVETDARRQTFVRSSGQVIRTTDRPRQWTSATRPEETDMIHNDDAELRIEPFSIAIPEDDLADLRLRIQRTRLPDPSPAPAWEQGTDIDYLRSLLAYWSDTFDWRAQERWLNGFAQFRANIDGIDIHFVHERAAGGRGIPLVLTHGWPSAFVEYLPVVPLLTDPAAHGIDGPAFDVIIPSLPGYAFSERPPRAGVTTRHTARMWHRLMRGLGYERYAAQGADFGSAVTTYMALDNAAPMIGIHLSNLDLHPYLGPGAKRLSETEEHYLAQYERWRADDRGYGMIQSTRPQSLGYGLNDSPAGLAAWILEKWRSWADSGGDIESCFSRDFLLTVVTLYWVTQSITTSMRDYVDNKSPQTLGPNDRVTVPTAISIFANQFLDDGAPPLEWAERSYDVRRWRSMPSGGHFAAAEQPRLLAQSIISFFAELGSQAPGHRP